MKEIEKIKAYIEAHSDELGFEIYGKGGWVEQASCEISAADSNNPCLTVFYVEQGQKKQLFSLHEKSLKIPRRDSLLKWLDEKEMNDYFLVHWRIHRVGGKKNQLVISSLSVDNYLKSIEIHRKKGFYLADKDEINAMIIDLQADICNTDISKADIFNRLSAIAKKL